ncbi:hypothetical protein EUGRSUZ_H04147 [Eucalyptus grandis]|uniref:Uncharacterized protein n=2 Tax=Eucalyptus grandis TaxID=71139 RepID=A0ACC3JVR8_EUCGR|nr:hypothetical protein EUGRSUZ_H04147 [Eucalyptus grandis]
MTLKKPNCRIFDNCISTYLPCHDVCSKTFYDSTLTYGPLRYVHAGFPHISCCPSLIQNHSSNNVTPNKIMPRSNFFG